MVSKKAKSYCGKSLKGTLKQRKWGEAIRDKFLDECQNDGERETVCNIPLFQYASMWIKARNSSLDDIYALVRKTNELKIAALEAQPDLVCGQTLTQEDKEKIKNVEKIQQEYSSTIEKFGV